MLSISSRRHTYPKTARRRVPALILGAALAAPLTLAIGGVTTGVGIPTASASGCFYNFADYNGGYVKNWTCTKARYYEKVGNNYIYGVWAYSNGGLSMLSMCYEGYQWSSKVIVV